MLLPQIQYADYHIEAVLSPHVGRVGLGDFSYSSLCNHRVCCSWTLAQSVVFTGFFSSEWASSSKLLAGRWDFGGGRALVGI